MPDVPFPYPGNKARLSSWILDYIPNHHCFVSVFGGAGGILFNKERSDVEVYNDKDKDLVNFFTILREREEELAEWLLRFPFSREMHREWANKFYDNKKPFVKHVEEYSEKYESDPEIVRAGIFFFLRYGQWGSKYGDNSGFAFSKETNDADSFASARNRLNQFAERFDRVVIDCLDWKDCMEKYDGENTVFYLDPPYYKDTSDQHYQVTGFDHGKFVRFLARTDANWVLSYAEMPPGLEDYHIESKKSKFMIGNGKSGEAKETVEHLIMNFDPNNTQMFHKGNQNTLSHSFNNGQDSDSGFGEFETSTIMQNEEETKDTEKEESSFEMEFNGSDNEEKEDTSQKETPDTNIAEKLDGIASGNKSSDEEEEEDPYEGFLEDVPT